MEMEALKRTMCPDPWAPVDGPCVDATRAAHMLTVLTAPLKPIDTKRVTTWLSKRMEELWAGRTPVGILAALPNPIAWVNGGAVWLAKDIEAMAPLIADSVGSIGRPRKKPAVVAADS
ncbi:MAG TPA: hypothetical protein VF867_07380 [Arthrobacter sp.]